MSRRVGATDAQVREALTFLAAAGFGTQFLSVEHLEFGARAADGQGTVEGWLRQQTAEGINGIILSLKARMPEVVREKEGRVPTA